MLDFGVPGPVDPFAQPSSSGWPESGHISTPAGSIDSRVVR